MPEQNNAFIIAAFVLLWLGVVGYALHLRRVRLAAEARMTRAREAVTGGGVA